MTVSKLLFATHDRKYVLPHGMCAQCISWEIGKHKKGSKSYESGYTRSRRSEMAEVREVTK